MSGGGITIVNGGNVIVIVAIIVIVIGIVVAIIVIVIVIVVAIIFVVVSICSISIIIISITIINIYTGIAVGISRPPQQPDAAIGLPRTAPPYSMLVFARSSSTLALVSALTARTAASSFRFGL